MNCEDPISAAEMADIVRTSLQFALSSDINAERAGSTVTFTTPHTGQQFKLTVEEVT